MRSFFFNIKSYLISMVIQMVAMFAWDMVVPNTSWGFALPHFVNWIWGTFIFCLAHSVQVAWHRWRTDARSSKELAARIKAQKADK